MMLCSFGAMNYKELATFVSYEVKDWALHLTASKLSALCVCVLSAIFVAGDPSQTWTLKSPRPWKCCCNEGH